MSRNDEPSVLEYARFYGLALDHRSPDPQSALSQDLHGILSVDESELLDITKDIEIPATERLECGRDAAKYLASIINAKSYPRSVGDYHLPKIHRIRDLKLEPPLLRSDHELDMRYFGGRMVPDLSSEHLPLENVNEERDEGLGWPSSYYEFYANLSAKSFKEKLTVSKDVLLYLRDVLQQYETAEGPPRYDSEVGQYRRVKTNIQVC